MADTQPLLSNRVEGEYGATSSCEGGVVERMPTPPSAEREEDIQDGVRRIEAVSRLWSKRGLMIAYLGIFLMAFTTSLEGQVTYSLSAFAVSSFNKHSLLSTVYVVQGVVNAVIKPPMAKIADVFGRLEAFSICIVLCVLGYILMAASQNVETYASAQIFYAAGFTGLQILQQVFIADTSDFLNRALFSSLPDSPFLVTVWIGPAIAALFLAKSTWRWGYAIWTIILPLAFLPLGLSLLINGRKAEKLGLVPKRRAMITASATTKTPSFTAAAKNLFQELDGIGILLFSLGLSLILIPLTLVSRSKTGWHDPHIILMILTGLFLLVLFPLWESRAPHPLLPLELLQSRTFVAGCLLGFFYFAVFYIAVQPYFYSYLLVALNLPVSRAGPITQTFSFASTIAAIAASLVIKRLGGEPRPKPWIVFGATIYTLAILLLIHTRKIGVSESVLYTAQMFLGAGAGLMHVATQLVVQAAASSSSNLKGRNQHQYVGVATAAFLTLVQVGSAVGSAVSGAIWGRLIPSKLRSYLPDAVKGEAGRIYGSVKEAVSYEWGSPEREAIARSYQETVEVLLWVALGVCVPVLAMAWGVGDFRLRGGDDGNDDDDHPRPIGEEERETGDRKGRWWRWWAWVWFGGKQRN
ncbi:putative siderophore iron transporter [Triangularia setosa]|uniref:Siderophore iron transporter n=1 Tax=Triangularia setosa TaxID=2587417 RepID=A0AAN7AA31_9PEZI|nr:putative siderophore iron transporter [Podospora setosa]